MNLLHNRITIAIDGHSSCGKSTLAKALAKHLGYIYVDTGAMYRAVTLYSMKNNLWTGDGNPDLQALQHSMPDIEISFTRMEDGTLHTFLNGEDVEREIRTLQVSEKVSPISTIDFVRQALVAQQQEMGKNKGVVMDGRDIGTTVFPNAELKIFLTASPEVRAQRRFLELQEKGTPASLQEVLHNIEERDRIDSTREVSPLRQAPDAVVIDNSHLTIEEQNEKVFALAQERINGATQQRGMVEIDEQSGFCFGVVTAIRRAEEELQKAPGELYCLGDIVHNTGEVERLGKMGLKSIDYEYYRQLRNKRVFFRAHGEPPSTYTYAQEHGIAIVDATCPVVLRLQERIREAYANKSPETQIVILGKRGHAEVNGLVGQTNGDAIVIQNREELENIDPSCGVILFAQTTMGLELFEEVVEAITRYLNPGVTFLHYDTICRQVSKRIPNIMEFAARHDRVFFIAGPQSSNGHVLFAKCKETNPKSFFVSDVSELTLEMVPSASESIGVCGATSTPHRQMEELASRIRAFMAQRRTEA